MQIGMLFDGLVVLVVALAAAFGAWKGFARLAAGMLAPTLGFAVGWPLSAEFPQLHRGLAFAAIYLAITLLIFGGAAAYRRRLERAKMEGWDNHLGLILGAAQGCVLALALTALAMAAFGGLRDQIAATRSGELMAQVVREIRPLIPQGASDFLSPWFDLLQRRNA